MPIHLTIIYSGSALLSFVLGTFAFIQSARSKGNIAFYAFTLIQFFWIATLYVGYFYVFRPEPLSAISTVYIKLAYGFGILMFPAIPVFFYYFPRKTTLAPLALRLLFWANTLFVFFAASFTSLIHKQQVIEGGVYKADTFGPLYNYYLYCLIGYLILAAAIAGKKVYDLDGLERKKVLMAAIGCWIFLFLAALTNVVLPLFGIYNIGPFYTIQNSPLYTLFFIIAAYYSIVKFRFFDFSTTSFNFLRNIILFGTFFVVTYGCFKLMATLFPGVGEGPANLISSVAGFLALTRVNRFVPELISQSAREFRNAVDEFKAKMYYCSDYDELRETLERIFLVRLHLVSAIVSVIRQSPIKEKRVPVYLRDDFTEILGTFRGDILIREEIPFLRIDNAKKEVLQRVMEQMGADYCLPLFSEKNLIGFLALKKNEKEKVVYGRDEIEWLAGMANDLGITLMNIMIKLNLQEENNLMKTIVDEKTKELRQRFNELQNLMHQQSDFIAVTAHEFRTPLTIAAFQLEDVLMQLDSKNPQDMKADLKVVDSSLANLKVLTQKLFEVQRYDLNKVELHPEPVKIGAYLEGVYNDFSILMEKKKLRLTFAKNVPASLTVSMDPSEIRQLLTNLLTNSSKFTPEGGAIELGVATGKDSVLITVTDNGKGVPDDMKESIFEKFRTNAPGMGIGLGLYICRKIAELHRGKLWVEDAPGGGARFCLELKA